MVFVGYLMVCGIVVDPFSVPYFRSTFFLLLFLLLTADFRIVRFTR